MKTFISALVLIAFSTIVQAGPYPCWLSTYYMDISSSTDIIDFVPLGEKMQIKEMYVTSYESSKRILGCFALIESNNVTTIFCSHEPATELSEAIWVKKSKSEFRCVSNCTTKVPAVIKQSQC